MSAEQQFVYTKYADVSRPTEMMTFELLLHILRSGLVWMIWLERAEQREAERRAREERYRFVELTYKLLRYYSTPQHAGMTHLGRCIVIAMKMSDARRTVTAAEVQAALLEADEMCLSEAV